MKPQRVPNGALEGPKWSPGGSKMEPGGSKMEPNGPRWGPGRGPIPPQGPQRGSSAALSSPSRHQDAVQGAQGRLVHGFASDFGPQKAPQGSQIGAKSGPKVSPQTSSFQIAFWSQILSILGSEKRHFWEPKTEPSAHTDCKVHAQNVLEKPIKNDLELGEILKKKGSKKRYR